MGKKTAFLPIFNCVETEREEWSSQQIFQFKQLERRSLKKKIRASTFSVHYSELLEIRLLTLSSSNFFPLVRFSFKIHLRLYRVNSFATYAYSSHICRLGFFYCVAEVKNNKKILTSKRNAMSVCCKWIYPYFTNFFYFGSVRSAFSNKARIQRTIRQPKIAKMQYSKEGSWSCSKHSQTGFINSN